MPSLGVLIAIQKDYQILLTKREDFPVWCLPGGAVDPHESLAQAAIREAQEETGFVVALTRLVGTYSRPNWQDGIHSILFAAQIIGGELKPDPNEVVDATFFSPTNLPSSLVGWHHQPIRDTFQATQPALAWSQDVQLSLSREELYAMRDRGELPLKEMMAAFCRSLTDETQHLEVGQINQVELVAS